MKRMTLFVNGLITQTRRYKISMELIVVEWNPPDGLPLLHEVLPKPKKKDYLVLRYILVPSDVHNRYRLAGNIPLFQMIAKNVGIRRAKGEFILCTNVDLLFSEELFNKLATKNLRKDTFYRANRCDVPDGIDTQWPLDQQLAWCRQHIIKRIGKDPRFGNANLEQFGLNNKAVWKKWVFDKMLFFSKMLWPPEKRKFYQIDTFACGDFTLMHREIWQDIQGYLEADLYSIHIDSLALLTATALGYKQQVFERKACTFHIDHPSGWERLGPLDKLKWLEERPGIGYDILHDVGLFLLKEKCYLNLNPDTWGFSNLSFEEHVFGY